jgi:hypothetical protein
MGKGQAKKHREMLASPEQHSHHQALAEDPSSGHPKLSTGPTNSHDLLQETDMPLTQPS